MLSVMQSKKIVLRVIGFLNILFALIFVAWSFFAIRFVGLDGPQPTVSAWLAVLFFCLVPLLSIACIFGYVGMRLVRLRLSMWICDLHIYVLGPAWLLFAVITFYYTFFQIADVSEKAICYLISFFSVFVGCGLIISFRSTRTLFKRTKT